MLQLFGCSKKKTLPFKEPQALWLCSLKHVTGTYPEPRKSNPSHNIFLFDSTVLLRFQTLALWSAITCMPYWQNDFNTSWRPLNVNAIRGFQITETGELPQTCIHSNTKFISMLKKKKKRFHKAQSAIRDVIQTVPMRSLPRHGQTGGQTLDRHMVRYFLLLREERLNLRGLSLSSHLCTKRSLSSHSSTEYLFAYLTLQCNPHIGTSKAHLIYSFTSY